MLTLLLTLLPTALSFPMSPEGHPLPPGSMKLAKDFASSSPLQPPPSHQDPHHTPSTQMMPTRRSASHDVENPAPSRSRSPSQSSSRSRDLPSTDVQFAHSADTPSHSSAGATVGTPTFPPPLYPPARSPTPEHERWPSHKAVYPNLTAELRTARASTLTAMAGSAATIAGTTGAGLKHTSWGTPVASAGAGLWGGFTGFSTYFQGRATASADKIAEKQKEELEGIRGGQRDMRRQEKEIRGRVRDLRWREGEPAVKGSNEHRAVQMEELARRSGYKEPGHDQTVAQLRRRHKEEIDAKHPNGEPTGWSYNQAAQHVHDHAPVHQQAFERTPSLTRSQELARTSMAWEPTKRKNEGLLRHERQDWGDGRLPQSRWAVPDKILGCCGFDIRWEKSKSIKKVHDERLRDRGANNPLDHDFAIRKAKEDNMRVQAEINDRLKADGIRNQVGFERPSGDDAKDYRHYTDPPS